MNLPVWKSTTVTPTRFEPLAISSVTLNMCKSDLVAPQPHDVAALDEAPALPVTWPSRSSVEWSGKGRWTFSQDVRQTSSAVWGKSQTLHPSSGAVSLGHPRKWQPSAVVSRVI